MKLVQSLMNGDATIQLAGLKNILSFHRLIENSFFIVFQALLTFHS